jgi:NADH-quinone oxidoreductase subunit A
MMENYMAVGIYTVVALAFPYLILFTSSLLRPTKAEEEKYITYESGIIPTGDAHIQHYIQFYLFAIIFAVFDVETIFLYPWALVFKSLGLFAVVEMFIFIIILIIGLAYAWKKGALEWI